MDWSFACDCRPVQASVQALKIEHDSGALEGFQLGGAIHLGEVLYGNIGGKPDFLAALT